MGTDTTTRPAVGPELDAAVARALGSGAYQTPVAAGMSLRALPHYSTDLAAAGLILDRWRQAGICIDLYSDPGVEMRWGVELTLPPFPSHTVISEDCDTLPEAIARAALLVTEATR